MSNYVFGSSLSYSDYLQAKSFERSLKGEISSATKSIIASNEELQREKISVLQSLSSSVSSGFENISIELGDVSAGIRALDATFQWGFSELLTEAGRMNDSLHELVRLAKTPAQTWAYEQFEIARDADRKGLFEEAIEYLNRAINGYGGQTGYKLEFRFHFLLGRIRLGSFRNYSKEIVDTEEAERSFLYAARYAAQDDPTEAGRALLVAGWAAYCRGDMENAQRLTQQAISFDAKLAEAHFQLAKVLMHVNNPHQALAPLQNAIELDRGYTIKAAADEDFKQYESQLSALFEKLREFAQKRVGQFFAKLQQDLDAVEEQRAREFHLVERLDWENFNKIVARADTAAGHNTYYGYLDALQYCHEAQTELKALSERMRATHQELLREIEARQRQRAQEEVADQARRFLKAEERARVSFWTSLISLLCCLLGPVGLILGISACSRYSALTKKDGIGFAIAAIVIGAITSAVVLVYGLGIIASLLEESSR